MSASVTSFDAQMAEGRLHAQLPAFQRRLEKTCAGIEAMLTIAPRCYVSISFGKQSICLAHLVMQYRPTIPMYFLASSETWALYDYESVVQSFVERFQPDLTIVQTDRLQGAASWKEARDVGDQDLQNMVPREDWDGWFWGLASEESRERRMTIAAGVKQRDTHPSIYRYADGKYRCCPLMDWTVTDLAAYIGRHDLPLLNIYKRYGLTQRTTARITKKMARNAGMALARMTSGPTLANIANRFPEIKIR